MSDKRQPISVEDSWSGYLHLIVGDWTVAHLLDSERTKRCLPHLLRALGSADPALLEEMRQAAMDDPPRKSISLLEQVEKARDVLIEIAELRDLQPGTDALAHVRDLARTTAQELGL
ncbi:MAG: hypothetical protein KatS3mg015_3255 [Fimbriimonadales bacterium]|nr:MAG: hypothetical protein KatS3mg015_3255 [Fimbriimonadales bacterium]